MTCAHCGFGFDPFMRIVAARDYLGRAVRLHAHCAQADQTAGTGLTSPTAPRFTLGTGVRLRENVRLSSEQGGKS